MSESTDRVYTAPREWAHVHPVSPLLGGWAVVAGAVGYWFTAGPGVPGGGDEMSSIDIDLPIARLALFVLLGALVAVAFGYLFWWFHTFRITDEAIEQRKGVMFRQHRQARLDRIQAVDVVQPLLGRIFGFGKLSIEVAGGENSGIQLQFLRLADAEALRNEVLALAAGIKADAAPRQEAPHGFHVKDELESFRLAPAPGSARTAVGAAEERHLVTVPIPRLLLSILFSWGTVSVIVAVLIFFGGAVVIGFIAPEVDPAAAILGGGLTSALAGLVGAASYAFATLNRGMNFRLGISQDGVRLAHGLLETRRQTVPPGRVQAVHFKQSLLWRRRDWWQIVVNVAGYQDNQIAVSTLLPVGTRAEALLALWTVLPDLGDPDPESTVSLALSGAGADGGFTPSPPVAKWLDPLQWHQRGVRATETALFIRRGRLVRELIVVPHERTQSLALTQGMLERWLGLANVHVHSTRGMVRPIAAHLSVADAIGLLESQAHRARQRRRLQTPEQWMAKVGLTEDAPDEG